MATQQSQRLGFNVNIGQQTEANGQKGIVRFLIALHSHQIQRRVLAAHHIVRGGQNLIILRISAGKRERRSIINLGR